MAFARPFAYNTGPTIPGTEQFGNLSIGIPTSGFTNSPIFWNGPDEDLGYVIAQSVPSNSQPSPVSGQTASVGFLRTTGKTESLFIELAEYVSVQFGSPQTFATGNDAMTWLESNGYWTSYDNFPSSLLVYLDSGNPSSYSGSGSTWYDLTSNNNDATLLNGPTYSSNYSGILQFNDTSLQYGVIPNIGNLTNWTVEVWFKLSTSLNGKVTSVVSNQFDLVNKLNYSIGTNNAPSNYNLAAGFFDAGGWHNTNGVATQTNVWYQVVGTYDGSVIREYVNGVASGGVLNYAGTPQSGGEVRLMRRWDSPLQSGNLVDGDLAIVKIYSSAITSTDVLQSYNDTYTRFIEPTPTPSVTPTLTPSVTPTISLTPSVTPSVTPTLTPSVTPTLTQTPTPSITASQTLTPTNTITQTTTTTPTPTSTPAVPVTSNLVLYYDPSNPSSYSGSGTVINDLSGNGLNGTMSNITFTSPYFSYNGINSQIAIPDNVLLEPGSGDWTIEVWVNQAVSGNDVVLGKFDNGGLTVDVSYSVRTLGTTYFAQIGSGSGSSSSLFVNSTNYVGTINTWSQIVYVFTNISANTLQTFVNGASIGTVSHSLPSILNSTNPLYIGSYNGGEYSQWFDGKIGITRLYNQALTSSQVLQNYNANKSKYGL